MATRTPTRTPIHHISLEIGALICLHLCETSEFDPAVLTTLATLARTCKSLSKPALDFLWCVIPGIIYLLYTLPSDLWTIRNEWLPNGAGPVRTLVFLREPIPDDFARLRSYAPRVNEILVRHTAPPSPVISPAAWAALERTAPRPFLPNVLALTHSEVCMNPGCEALRWPTGLLVGPQLRVAALGLMKTTLEAQPVRRLFADLSRGAPLLRSVDISVRQQPVIFSCMALGSEICGLSNLVSFTAPLVDLQPEALAHLAALPCLTTISIKAHLWTTANTGFPFASEQDHCFPALRDARIATNSFEWCAALVRLISSPHLRSLVIDSRAHTAKAPAFEALLAAIAQLKCIQSLRELSIFAGDEQAGVFPGPTVITSEMLLPLTALTALRRVRILGWCKVVLDDPTLEALAKTWPELQYLDFRWPPTPQRTMFKFASSAPRVTLRGLASLARLSPRLRSLLLPIDARTVPVLDPRPGDPRPASGALEMLSVGESPIADPMRVGSYLSLFFPDLRDFVHGFMQPHAWDEFALSYTAFLKVRESERRRRAQGPRGSALTA